MGLPCILHKSNTYGSVQHSTLGRRITQPFSSRMGMGRMGRLGKRKRIRKHEMEDGYESDKSDTKWKMDTNAITVIILFDGILLGIEVDMLPTNNHALSSHQSFSRLVLFCQSSLALIYFLEAFLRFYAQRPEYFNHRWNQLDALLVVSSFLRLAVFVAIEKGGFQGERMKPVIILIEIFRMARLIRLLRSVKDFGCVSQTRAFRWYRAKL